MRASAKQFQALAELVVKHHPIGEGEKRRELALGLLLILQVSNPRIDREKFLLACFASDSQNTGGL